MSKLNLLVNRGSSLLIVAVMLVLLSCGAIVANAQTTGTIYGRVTDPNGAGVPGATVTVANTGTDLKRTSNTDSEGLYSFTLLPVGKYNISVNAQGFKPYRTSYPGRAT